MNKTDVFLRVMSFVSKRECEECVWWSEDLEVFVRLNDIFFWACSDVEQITSDNVDEFEKAFADVDAASDEKHWGLLHADDASMLFACRVRKMRPQNAIYSGIHSLLMPLFDACGPEREPGFGNPYTREMALQQNRELNSQKDPKPTWQEARIKELEEENAILRRLHQDWFRPSV